MQLATPVDAEQAVIDELSALGYNVGTSLPQSIPAVFVRVLTVGGIEQTIVSDTFTVTVEVFATRETSASTAARTILARLQLAALRGKLGAETCYEMRVGALPQNYPLPTVPSHKRYVMTLAPTLRRRVTTV